MIALSLFCCFFCRRCNLDKILQLISCLGCQTQRKKYSTCYFLLLFVSIELWSERVRSAFHLFSLLLATWWKSHIGFVYISDKCKTSCRPSVGRVQTTKKISASTYICCCKCLAMYISSLLRVLLPHQPINRILFFVSSRLQLLFSFVGLVVGFRVCFARQHRHLDLLVSQQPPLYLLMFDSVNRYWTTLSAEIISCVV